MSVGAFNVDSPAASAKVRSPIWMLRIVPFCTVSVIVSVMCARPSICRPTVSNEMSSVVPMRVSASRTVPSASRTLRVLPAVKPAPDA